MPKHLQQTNVGSKNTNLKVGVAPRTLGLKANIALLLALILSIIPTISGVALIA